MDIAKSMKFNFKSYRDELNKRSQQTKTYSRYQQKLLDEKVQQENIQPKEPLALPKHQSLI
jgi:hypothetical protein